MPRLRDVKRSINRQTLLTLLLSGLVLTACGTQIPFEAQFSIPTHNINPLFNEGWNFTHEAALNSTHNLVFSTVSSLLQHWPNTRYRNGHSIIPATLPPGTLLYHGTFKNEIPTIPEWAATDPEHSYLFCRSMGSNSGCWHLTLVSTRPLKLLYFDGSSAAKLEGGPMDSQDLVIWGNVKPEKTFRERERIEELCAWGEQYNLDGFVRMEMNFEIMICDFSSGLTPVSFLSLSGPKDPIEHLPTTTIVDSFPGYIPTTRSSPIPHIIETTSPYYTSESEIQVLGHHIPQQNLLSPPKSIDSFSPPTFNGPGFRVLESGSWHNHYPGDMRIHLDLTKLVSFYDTGLFSSLVESRFLLSSQKYSNKKHPRLNHRLDGISKQDVEVMKKRLDEVLGVKTTGNEGATPSDIDWKSIFRVVQNRYGERLEVLEYILNSTSSTPFLYEDDEQREKTANATLNRAFGHISGMLAPYRLHSARPSSSPGFISSYTWAVPVFKLCTATHTLYIDSDPILFGKLTKSEKLLLDSVTGVQKEICRVLVGIWAEGMEAGLKLDEEARNEQEFTTSVHDPLLLLASWKKKTEKLMAWLDWSSIWVKCRPGCGPEEICYLPTWPFFRGRRRGPQDGSRPEHKEPEAGLNLLSSTDGDEDDDWVDPQPMCIRRVE